MTTWHLVTGEYPPAIGGLSDYSRAVAAGLAAAGDDVHVWCPPPAADSPIDAAVHVHPIAGGWHSDDLRRLDDALDRFAPPRRLLVQWIPHAYGHRSLNVAFCRWVRRRARAGDEVDLMIHEPGLGFREGALRHDAAAALHRMMLMLLLGRARRVWVAIPAWVETIRPWTFGRRDLPVRWLPVPSSIPVATDPGDARAVREAVVNGPDDLIVGHFSTYSPAIRQTLGQVVPALLADAPRLQVQLLGRGSAEALAGLRSATPSHDRLYAAGELDAAALSAHLQACDLLLQPYPDGASSRRTTLMAALAHGVPVVTTVGRLSEPFWSQSGAIVAVPADDSAALARAVAGLLAEPERRALLGAAGRAAYDAQFSLQHVIAALRADACEAAA
jgi:glycosyltransferase involved in cell wall biosynthesis